MAASALWWNGCYYETVVRRGLESTTGLPTPARSTGWPMNERLSHRQTRDLDHRTNFDCAPLRHRNPLGDGDRRVEISGVDQEVAAQLLARLRERPVGHEAFALANPHAGCHRGGVQWGGGE